MWKANDVINMNYAEKGRQLKRKLVINDHGLPLDTCIAFGFPVEK